MVISWSTRFGFQCFTYQIKAKEVSLIHTFEDQNSDMQSLRYEENRKAVWERRQEQSSATLCREILISWSSGFGVQCFAYQIKAKEVSSILTIEELNSDKQGLIYEENHKAVSERRQKLTRATLCKEMLISWSLGFGFQCFKNIWNLRRQALFWPLKIWTPICRARDTKKSVRQYQKEGRNNQARRYAGKWSYTSHLDLDLNVSYIKSELTRQALF